MFIVYPTMRKIDSLWEVTVMIQSGRMEKWEGGSEGGDVCIFMTDL